MRAELEALERVRAANPVPDDDQVGGPDLTALFAAVEERRSTMSTGMRERTGTEERGPRRRVVAVGVFVAALLVVIVAVGVIPLLVGNDDEIAPAEQTTTTTVPQTTTMVEPAVDASPFTWSDAVVIPWMAGPIREVVQGPTGYLAVGGGRQFAFSSDGADWAPVRIGDPVITGPVAAVGTDREFLVVSGAEVGGWAAPQAEIHLSSDGRSWARVAEVEGVGVREPGPFGDIWQPLLDHGSEGYILADPDGPIAHSANGREWALVVGEEPWGSPLDDGDLEAIVRDVTYGPAGYVAVAEMGTPRPDARVWPPLDSPFSSVWLSPDGRSWERVETSGDFGDLDPGLSGVVHGPGGYVAVGLYGGTWVSQDGRDWQRVSSEHMGLELAAGDAGYLAIGSSHVWYSPDGIDWRMLAADDLPDEGQVTGVSVLGDRLLLRGHVDVDGRRTHVLWWGVVNE